MNADNALDRLQKEIIYKTNCIQLNLEKINKVLAGAELSDHTKKLLLEQVGYIKKNTKGVSNALGEFMDYLTKKLKEVQNAKEIPHESGNG